MLQSSVFIAILMLVNLNCFIECGGKRQTVCLKELNDFSFRKPTGNTSSDTRPRICSSNSTCCNKTIEEGMKTHITKRLMNLINGQNEKARRQFKDVYDDLEDVFQNVLEQVSDSAIKSLQPNANGHLAQRAKPHIRTLADELLSSVTKKDLHVENYTMTFFANFYPLVHEYMVLKSKLPQEFAECLKDNVRVIMPFKDVPQTLTDFLIRKLQPVQQFLRGLQTIGRVLDVVDNVELSDECSAALVKMSQCPLCDGYSHIKPCGSYCTNVLSSCLEPYNHIEGQWSTFITKLEKLRPHLAKSLDAANMFEKFQELVSDSISHASHAKVGTKVSQYCRNITDYTGNKIISLKRKQTDSIRALSGNADLYLTTDVENSYGNLPTAKDIRPQLDFVKRNLTDIKKYFKMFNINICWNEGLSASQIDSKCWVGTHIGRNRITPGAPGSTNYDVDLSPVNNETIADDVLLLLREAIKDVQRRKHRPEIISGSGEGSASGEGSGGSGEITELTPFSGTDCDDDDDDEDCSSKGSGDKKETVSADEPMKTAAPKRTTKPTNTLALSKASILYHTRTVVLGVLILHIIFSR